MKSKTILLLFLSAILFIALKPHGGNKNSGQSPLGRTGAPGETTCGGCHSGGSYSGSMTFEFGTKNASEYEPGETYLITFTGEYGAPRYGFSITVLDADDNPAGDFTLVNEDNTSFGTLGNGRQYVGHKAADATNEWIFEWTAPSQDVGPVTFYYVINAANGDGGTGGDFIETGSTSIQPAEETQIAEVDNTGTVSVFPNPATSYVTIRVNCSELEVLKIFDLQGRLVHHILLGNYEYSVDVSALDPAIYLLQVRTAEQTSIHRIYVKP